MKRFGFRSSVKPLVVMLFMAGLLTMLALLAGCGSSAQKAAEFGGTVITEEQINDYTAQLRQRIDCEDDAAWKAYLTGQGMDVKEWREEVIRTMATETLVRERAEELGIQPKEEDVARSITSTKARFGVAQDDEEGWEATLKSLGTTPEAYRESCEYASLKQQLVLTERADEIKAAGEELDSYISKNLADRIVCSFKVLSFAEDERDQAQEAFDELSALSGDELESRFDQLIEERSDMADLFNGNLGWDALYETEGLLDSNIKINLKSGELYPKLVDADGQWQIYLCEERFVFAPGVTYGTLSESLQNCVESLAIASNLSAIASEYLTDLVTQANIQVHPMPSGLPYDVH